MDRMLAATVEIDVPAGPDAEGARRATEVAGPAGTSRVPPFSEAQFRTFKYRPEFPDRFGSREHARGVSHDLFTWYNNAHQKWTPKPGQRLK